MSASMPFARVPLRCSSYDAYAAWRYMRRWRFEVAGRLIGLVQRLARIQRRCWPPAARQDARLVPVQQVVVDPVAPVAVRPDLR